MRREIAEQPATVAATLAALHPLTDEIGQLARDRGHVLLYGRGTSGNAALYGRYLIEKTSGRVAALGTPSLATLYGARPDLSDALVVVCSQSGATTEMIDVAGWARERGARTIGITNASVSPLGERVDLALVTQCGLERAVPATKTCTGALVAVALLADALCPRRQAWATGLDHLADDVRLALTCDLEPAAKTLAGIGSLIAIGRGLTLGAAQEVALKIAETTGITCVGLSSSDLQHGPTAMFNPRVGVVVMAAANGPTRPGLDAMTRVASDRGCPTVVVGDLDGGDRGGARVRLCRSTVEELVPIVLAIPGQQLAAAMAERLGLSPDHPNGLSKITQTVQ